MAEETKYYEMGKEITPYEYMELSSLNDELKELWEKTKMPIFLDRMAVIYSGHEVKAR